LFDIDTVLGWRGNTVRDRAGEKIGTVGDVFLDRETDRPAWIGVSTGWFGNKQSYVSLSNARAAADEVHLPYDKEQVKGAPQIDPDVALTREEEEALYRHYGEDYGSTATGDAEEVGGARVASSSPTPDAGEAGAASGAHAASDAAAGDSSAPAGGGMVRSEEEVRLGHVERRPTERVRIKKVLVTDQVKQVVPVEREVIQLEHERAPEGAVDPAGEPEPSRPVDPTREPPERR